MRATSSLDPGSTAQVALARLKNDAGLVMSTVYSLLPADTMLSYMYNTMERECLPG